MKLKTLKDIREEFIENYGVEIPDQAEVYPRIKAEAIKWRKFFDVERKIITREDWDNFFNITSENLK